MSEERVVYSIQRTYILNVVSTSGKEIITCDQRIDIPTIEPLTEMKAYIHQDEFFKIIPCIELAGGSADKYEFLSGLNLEFETNEGVTVLPVKINRAQINPIENPYMNPRFVLVLPRGATGVKSCKITLKGNGEEVQHNLTFGIMPPPYNYDNALISYSLYQAIEVTDYITELSKKVDDLKLSSNGSTLDFQKLSKGGGKKTIQIKDGVLFYETEFRYPSSTEVTTHKPKITLSGGSTDLVYTLSLNKNRNTVLIDLLTGTITAFDSVTGEIIQQLKVSVNRFITLSFEAFDDIVTPALNVTGKGRKVTT